MRSVSGALKAAVLVAKAGCAAAKRRVGPAAVGTALALMLGLGGCSMSHGGRVDADGDGHYADVDCNDDDPTIYPGAPEPGFPDCCDAPAIDHDCDGMPMVCACNPFPDDLDGDGYGRDVDCNDDDPTIYPGAPEDECDVGGPDRNCDGVPPGAICNPFPEVDEDGDGYFAYEDCDDTDPNIHPDAPEEACPDGADQNCDGADGSGDPAIRCAPVDADGDGYPRYYDCDDSEAWINPGVMEHSCPDGVDQDCDGVDGEPGIICNGMADVDPSDCAPA